MRQAFVHRLSMRGPGDTEGLEAAIAAGTVRPEGILAILGKTEGNGCVNDFSRGFATQSLGLALRRHMSQGAADKVCLVMSGGTEGGLSPHLLVFSREPATSTADGKRLAAGGCDRLVRVFDLSAGYANAKLEQQIENHADWVLGVALAADGKHLLT